MKPVNHLKHSRLFTLTLFALLSCAAAQAQPVEAVPLSAPSYTLKTETDPMAMDPGSVTPDETVKSRGEALPATPPPGTDDQPGTSGSTDSMTSPTNPPSDFSSSDSAPAPVTMDSERTPQSYPNNNVSGVVPSDEKKFENRTFCTLKISFTSIGSGVDQKTADKVKNYLDTNAENLTYKKAVWGKEGEFDYCIDIPTHNQRAKIYTGLKRLLPPKDSGDMRTVLTGKGFTRVENSQ